MQDSITDVRRANTLSDNNSHTRSGDNKKKSHDLDGIFAQFTNGYLGNLYKLDINSSNTNLSSNEFINQIGNSMFNNQLNFEQQEKYNSSFLDEKSMESKNNRYNGERINLSSRNRSETTNESLLLNKRDYNEERIDLSLQREIRKNVSNLEEQQMLKETKYVNRSNTNSLQSANLREQADNIAGKLPNGENVNITVTQKHADGALQEYGFKYNKGDLNSAARQKNHNNLNVAGKKHNNINEASTKHNNINEASTKHNNINEASTKHNNINEASTKYNNINEASTKYNNINEASTKYNNINEASTKHSGIKKADKKHSGIKEADKKYSSVKKADKKHQNHNVNKHHRDKMPYGKSGNNSNLVNALFNSGIRNSANSGSDTVRFDPKEVATTVGINSSDALFTSKNTLKNEHNRDVSNHGLASNNLKVVNNESKVKSPFKNFVPKRPIHIASNLTRINVDIAKQVAKGFDRISIQLRPHNMGRVDVQIDLSQDVAQLRVLSDNPQTLNLLQSNSQGLIDAFASTGFDISDTLSFDLQKGSEFNDNALGKNGNFGSKLAYNNNDASLIDDMHSWEQLDHVRNLQAIERGGLDVRV